MGFEEYVYKRRHYCHITEEPYMLYFLQMVQCYFSIQRKGPLRSNPRNKLRLNPFHLIKFSTVHSPNVVTALAALSWTCQHHRSTCACLVWLERLMTPRSRLRGGLGGSLGVIVEVVIACATTLGLTTALWVSESTSRSRDERIVHMGVMRVWIRAGGKSYREVVFCSSWRLVARED